MAAMKKLVIFEKGKEVGEIRQGSRGRLRATKGRPAELVKAVRNGAILFGGEEFKVEEIFEKLPLALDGAYLAAKLVEA